MNKSARRSISVIVLSAFIFLQILPFLPTSIQNAPLVYTLKKASLFKPLEIVDAAGLSSSSATLSNPRLSYIGGVSASYAAGVKIITITGSGNADNTTNHLFPGDLVGVGSSTVQNMKIPIDTIIDSTSFSLRDPLVNAVTNVDKVYATQSGSLTVQVYTADPIPNNGSIRIDVPAANGAAVSGGTNDGIPDTAASGSNGFDLNKMTTANISCPNGFTVGTVTAGGANHVIYCNWVGGATLSSGANLSVRIGNPTTAGGIGLVNPGPNLTHTQGQADIYTIRARTNTGTNGAGSDIDDLDIKIAPVEGVRVSATVDETLSFTVAGGVTSANIAATCNISAPAGNTITSTATSIPFGTVVKETMYNGAQLLTVSTNAPGGYTVNIEETDQMGKDGVKCVGASAGESVNCIKDTQCDGGACTESTGGEWVTTPATATAKGLGYTISNVTGTYGTAGFLIGYSGRTFNAMQLADMEGAETKQTIMTHAAVATSDAICAIFRLQTSATQPAGTYWNTVKYTASAIF